MASADAFFVAACPYVLEFPTSHASTNQKSFFVLQGYLDALASTVDNLQQGAAAMAASTSSLSTRLDQAYGEAVERKQDAGATRIPDAYKVRVVGFGYHEGSTLGSCILLV
jgi:hypothetical protein